MIHEATLSIIRWESFLEGIVSLVPNSVCTTIGTFYCELRPKHFLYRQDNSGVTAKKPLATGGAPFALPTSAFSCWVGSPV